MNPNLPKSLPALSMDEGHNAYRTRFRGEAMHIVAPDGRVVAAEGDLVGVNGTVRDGGSFCMSGPQLHVSRIVDVVRRDGQ